MNRPKVGSALMDPTLPVMPALKRPKMMYVLAVAATLTADPTINHIIHTEPMPLQVCQDMADKVNIPLLFPKQVTFGNAVCVPAKS
jgi:hypothetical protein